MVLSLIPQDIGIPIEVIHITSNPAEKKVDNPRPKYMLLRTPSGGKKKFTRKTRDPVKIRDRRKAINRPLKKFFTIVT